jgi:hypothetical protein
MTGNKVVYLTSTISWTFGVVDFAFFDFDKSTHVPKTVGRSHTRLKLPFATFPERLEKNEYLMHKSHRDCAPLLIFGSSTTNEWTSLFTSIQVQPGYFFTPLFSLGP